MNGNPISEGSKSWIRRAIATGVLKRNSARQLAASTCDCCGDARRVARKHTRFLVCVETLRLHQEVERNADSFGSLNRKSERP